MNRFIIFVIFIIQVFSTNFNGTEFVSRIYDVYGVSVGVDHDGGIIFGTKIMNGSKRISYVKYDNKGNLAYLKSFGSVSRDLIVNFVSETSDGGIICCGHSSDILSGDIKPFIAKLILDGSIDWFRYYSPFSSINAVKETNSNEIISVGSFPSSNPFIMKLKNDGSIIWVNRYDFGSETIRDMIPSISEVSSGKYVVTASASDSFIFFSMNVFSFGIVLWILYYEDANPYGENVTFVENKVASNPYFRPPFDDNLPIPGWLKNLIISCLEHAPEKRRSFEEIFNYLKKKTNSIDIIVGKNTSNEEKDEKLESIFIYIKLIDQDRSSAERFFLIKRDFKSLMRIVRDRHPKSEIRGLYLYSLENVMVKEEESMIKNDEDVQNKLTSNCLINIDEFDERDTIIMKLKNDMNELKFLDESKTEKINLLEMENKELKKQLESYTT